MNKNSIAAASLAAALGFGAGKLTFEPPKPPVMKPGMACTCSVGPRRVFTPADVGLDCESWGRAPGEFRQTKLKGVVQCR